MVLIRCRLPALDTKRGGDADIGYLLSTEAAPAKARSWECDARRQSRLQERRSVLQEHGALLDPLTCRSCSLVRSFLPRNFYVFAEGTKLISLAWSGGKRRCLRVISRHTAP